MIRTWCVVGLAGAFLLAGAPARADEKDKPDPEALFKKLDTDKDGKISKDEFKSLFTDPKLNLPEKLKKDTKLQDELFKKYDTDNDGYINLEEFKALWKDLEKQADKDKDKEKEKDK
jgi:Ca2+-binding EF-hand superfamily protein